MKLITFISAGIFIVFAGMVMKKQNAEQRSLYETKWLLRKIHTENGVEDVNTKAFIKFDETKKSAGGNGSCNSFGSTVEIKGNEINFMNVFSTKIYCEGVQKTEDAFFRGLEKATRYEIKDKTLLIYNSNDLLLEFTDESK
ncbi:MAG TPA: META domain-containing protein [Chitinophagaceae bacterium]|jgi:heat shock protein HslJ|nr:META domain-containing protein [Chitinophagaceae bacterium]